MASLHLPDLSLARRPQLFADIAAFEPAPDTPFNSCTFGGRKGWLISDFRAARSLLTSSAGRKSRPRTSQEMLGGVGVLRGRQVRHTKRQLIAAMGLEARSLVRLSEHLRGALRGIDGAALSGRLTEAFAGAMLTQLTGQEPGSIDGQELRELVFGTWGRLERPSAPSSRQSLGVDDALGAFTRKLVTGGDSAFLGALREESWSDGRIAEELRAMVLAGWGSTAGATLSAIALGVRDPIEAFALDEVLRLYPPSFMIGRTITERSSTFPFEPDELIVVSPWLIHRNTGGWSDPQEFDLRRWRNTPAPRWFLPFGIGPRRCPAATFARAHIAAGLRELGSGPLPTTYETAMVEGRSPALLPRNA